ncbi:hypothetical protein T492DRAFT_1143097 [Pavlovales sp. CCMP2436]|nr:hypothetical protein T492DRAFT_1143097 [Pavlovales sp. CCMP2436]|mmetsp:Transcript_15100/g.38317  ORF Transcript_15100/g.38317 Transcript_15100/m.38317 type:complete len:202 (-) Transcript_15100:197-802(-)
MFATLLLASTAFAPSGRSRLPPLSPSRSVIGPRQFASPIAMMSSELPSERLARKLAEADTAILAKEAQVRKQRSMRQGGRPNASEFNPGFLPLLALPLGGVLAAVVLFREAGESRATREAEQEAERQEAAKRQAERFALANKKKINPVFVAGALAVAAVVFKFSGVGGEPTVPPPTAAILTLVEPSVAAKSDAKLAVPAGL